MKTKITAVLTAACFIALSVFGQAVYAVNEAAGASEIVKSSDSFIPFSAGKVTYAKNFNSKDIVINIQDLHCHGEAQKNIAAILKALEKYGFDKIYLEGAVADVSTEKFINFRTSELGKLVVDDLLANGTLSGAEYYSIKSGKAGIIKALDKSDLYFENVLLLGNIFNNREEINAELKGLQNDIQSVKKEYYNSDLLRLDKFNGDFSKGKISAKKYYSVLSKLSSKAGININAYANVHKYISLINEKGIDYGKVSDELRVFVNILKETLSYGIYQELSAKSNDFSNIEDLFPVFAALSDSFGICKQHKLNNLAAFFKYLKSNDDLNLLNFTAEEDMLIHDIGISLSRTEYERDIVFLSRFVKVLDGFFNTKITSDDYAYYIDNRKIFDKTAAKYLGENIYLANLKEKITEYEKYHSNNIKRDDVFFSSLPGLKENAGSAQPASNDFTDLKILTDYAAKGSDIKIVITGGFHSEGLKKRLSENKTSFIIITPNVTGNVEKAESMYFSVISEYAQVFTSALSAMPSSGEPLQIALPKIIGATINRARINQMPLGKVEELINKIFSEEKSKIAATESSYEHVIGARVKIDPIKDNEVRFMVFYDYGYGDEYQKHRAYYAYNFETKSVFLTVDSLQVQKMYDGFFPGGEEGLSPFSVTIRYGSDSELVEIAASFYKELRESLSPGALNLLDPQQFHSSLVAYRPDHSPLDNKEILNKKLTKEDFEFYKGMMGQAFPQGVSSFKAPLNGYFVLSQNGVIIYRLYDKKLLEGFARLRQSLHNEHNEEFWYDGKIVHITIGRLVPGKYTQDDIDKLNAILPKYYNLFAKVEFIFDSATYGSFSSTGGKELNVEVVKFGSAAQNEKTIPKQADGDHENKDYNDTGGFIGKFAAPVVHKVERNADNPEIAVLEVSLLSDGGESTMEISGRFIDKKERLQSVLDQLSKQNESEEFKRVMEILSRVAGGKTAETIKFFEIETAHTEVDGLRTNITAEVVGFSSYRFRSFGDGGIIALREGFFDDDLALFHEFVHWALAKGMAQGGIQLEAIESAVTNDEIRKEYIAREPFDKSAAGARSNRISEKERYDSVRMHNAIRAFQAQYFSGADAELTSLIRKTSKDYRDASMRENEAAKNKIIGKFASILNAFAAKKEKGETAKTIKKALAKTVKPKRVKSAEKTEEPVEIYDQMSVFGSAKLLDKTTLVLDKDALQHLNNYTPGNDVYILSLPKKIHVQRQDLPGYELDIEELLGGHIFLFIQPEALDAFVEKIHEKSGHKFDDSDLYSLYPNTVKGVIDNGVLKIILEEQEGDINTFAEIIGEETEFLMRGAEHGVIRILTHEEYAEELAKENDPTVKIIEDHVRMISEIIMETESSAAFNEKINIASRFLNEDQKDIALKLKPVLERMLKEKGLNGDQKAFTLLLLAAISAAENPNIDYVKEQINEAGEINAYSLILWLEMINNPGSELFFSEIIGDLHLDVKSSVSACIKAAEDALSLLTVRGTAEKAVAVSENKQWLLKTERAKSPGERMLYGKIFMDAEMYDSDIDFGKLEKLKDFGVKPVALTLSKKRDTDGNDKLCYVVVDVNEEPVLVAVYLRMEKNIPIIAMVPLKFEKEINKEFYVKASKEVLSRLQNDYIVKGKYARFARGISPFKRTVNLFSNVSLYRMIGEKYAFDLKAFVFDSENMPEFAGAVTEIFPDALDIQKSAAGNNLNYDDISKGIDGTKKFILSAFKKLVSDDKEPVSAAVQKTSPKILAAAVSAFDSRRSVLSPYFENKAEQSELGSPTVMLTGNAMESSVNALTISIMLKAA